MLQSWKHLVPAAAIAGLASMAQAADPIGSIRQCVELRVIREARVIDDRTVLLRMKSNGGGGYKRMDIQDRCRGLPRSVDLTESVAITIDEGDVERRGGVEKRADTPVKAFGESFCVSEALNDLATVAVSLEGNLPSSICMVARIVTIDEAEAKALKARR